MLEGSDPDKPFEDKSMNCNDDILKIPCGIGPDRLLPERDKSPRLTRLAISLGISPARRLGLKISY